MVATRLAPVITALLAGSGIVHGKCAIKPDVNGHVNWPKERTIIKKKAFKNCTDLKSINIPPTVVFIANTAFMGSGLNLLELTAALEKRIAELEAKCGETDTPTGSPTVSPSATPSATPTVSPSATPTVSPKDTPTVSHTPSVFPTSMLPSLLAECDMPCTSTALVKILPPANTYGRFGTSIAVEGDTLVVGNPGERSGAAYVFYRQPSGMWVMTHRITPSVHVPNCYFGRDIAFDGKTLLIGADGIGGGAAYIFTLQAGQWVETQKLTAADNNQGWPRFGFSVAVHGDTLVVGAYLDNDELGRSTGLAYIFSLKKGENENRKWKQSAKLVALDRAEGDSFGHSVAMSQGLVAVGTPLHDSGAGAVYVYKSDTLGGWMQAHKLRPSVVQKNARFGKSVAVSDDGTVVVGAPGSGSVYVFSCTAADDCMETNVLFIQSRVDNHYFGSSVAISCDTIVVGAHTDDNNGQRSGSVHTFTRQPAGRWVETNKIVPMPGVMGDNFGIQVAVSKHTVAAGASNGLAYVKEVCD